MRKEYTVFDNKAHRRLLEIIDLQRIKMHMSKNPNKIGR